MIPILALLNQMLIGYGYGWTAPTLMKLTNPSSAYPITASEASWIASLHECGKMSSPFASPFIIDKIGRKYTVVLVTVLFLVIWPSHIFVHDFYYLCLLRILFGVATGLFDVIASIYYTEICTSTLRGIIGTFSIIIYSGGQVLETILATYLTNEMSNSINSIVTICALGSLYFCIETPSFSLMKQKHKEAERNLKWLRGDLKQSELSVELEKLKCNVKKEKLKQKSMKTLFSSPESIRSFCIVLFMYWCFSCSGNNAIGAFGGMIFPSSETFTSSQFNILYVAGNFVAVCLSLLVVGQVSRRTLLISTHLVITVCNICLFLLFYFHRRNYEIPLYPWLVFASIVMTGFARSLASPIMFIVRGELLPLSIRAIGGCMSTILTSLGTFCVTKTFLTVTEYFGMETNFLIYTVVTLFMTVVMYYTLPETKGKSLEEIQEE
mgnify:CR=1 FL=1